jgi:hypothetical protein
MKQTFGENRRSTGTNRRLAKKRVLWLNEVLYFVSNLVLADSLLLRNPLLRQAPKRCATAWKNATEKKKYKSYKILFTN